MSLGFHCIIQLLTSSQTNLTSSQTSDFLKVNYLYTYVLCNEPLWCEIFCKYQANLFWLRIHANHTCQDSASIGSGKEFRVVKYTWTKLGYTPHF